MKKQMVMKMDGTISKAGSTEMAKLIKVLDRQYDKKIFAEAVASVEQLIKSEAAQPTKQKKSKLINSYKIMLVDGTIIVGDTKKVQELSAAHGGSVHLMSPTKKSKANPDTWIPLFKTGLHIIKL